MLSHWDIKYVTNWQENVTKLWILYIFWVNHNQLISEKHRPQFVEVGHTDPGSLKKKKTQELKPETSKLFSLTKKKRETKVKRKSCHLTFQEIVNDLPQLRYDNLQQWT